MIDRDTLFAMAAKPIGGSDVDALAKTIRPGVKPPAEVVEAAKRASKVWLPCGKSSANSREARDADREAKARNYDLEDAVEQAGGARGCVRAA